MTVFVPSRADDNLETILPGRHDPMIDDPMIVVVLVGFGRSAAER